MRVAIHEDPQDCWASQVPETRGDETFEFFSQKTLSDEFGVLGEIFVGHSAQRMKHENARNLSPKFRPIFRACVLLTQKKLSPHFRSGSVQIRVAIQEDPRDYPRASHSMTLSKRSWTTRSHLRKKLSHGIVVLAPRPPLNGVPCRGHPGLRMQGRRLEILGLSSARGQIPPSAR